MHNDLSWSSALKPMIQTAPPQPGIYVAVGPRHLPSWFLSALCPALKHGTDLFWIDAENSFDAYGASYATRALGWNPKDVLRHIRIARPFNPFQLETMVCKKLPVLWHEEPVVISDPFPMLYDPDLPVPEGNRIVKSVLVGMKALPAIWIILVRNRDIPKDRTSWLNDLLRQASAVAHLQAYDDRWRLEKV